MKARGYLAASAIAACLALAAWWLLDDEALRNAEVGTVSDSGFASPAPETPRVAASPPASATPRRAGVASAPARLLPRTLFGDFATAKQYRELYDRLRDSAEGKTPEGQLVLYEILRQCATVAEARRFTGVRPSIPKRDEFVAGLAPNDPLREKRIAAFDDFTANRCAGFEGVSITQAELTRMLREAASAGDPRARAIAIEQDLWQARRQAGDNRATLSDAQIEGLKQSLATRDPEAMRVAGRVLATSWNDYALRVGPNQLPIEPRPFMNAWLVMACEYGAPCGADTPRMQQACALQGHCDAASYPDYLLQYGSTPHDSTLVFQYREVLRNAIETGDWSQVSVVRGLPPAHNRAWFVAGPR